MRNAFVQPSGAAAESHLANEAVGEFVLEDARKFFVHGIEALHGDADATVIERAGPAGSAGDVAKSLLGIEDDADGLGGSEMQRDLDGAEMVFESAHDFVGELRSGAALIVKDEVARAALAGLLLDAGIAFCFFQERSDLRIGLKALRGFPFFYGVGDTIRAVVGPSGKSSYGDGIGRDLAGLGEIVERGGIFAADDVNVSKFEKRGEENVRLLGGEGERGAQLLEGLLGIVVLQLEISSGDVGDGGARHRGGGAGPGGLFVFGDFAAVEDVVVYDCCGDFLEFGGGFDGGSRAWEAD